MANQKYFIRYSKIIYRVKRGDYPSSEIILDYLSENGFDINKRTLSRDLNAILELFDTEIIFDRTEKGYLINPEETDYNSSKLLETLELFSSIKIVGKEKNIISFEKRKSKGTEHMYYILDAIKNTKPLNFEHLNYHKQKITQRKVEPYLLKESQGRWYLVAKDKKDNIIKTFGLDRMSLLYSESTCFSKPKDFDAGRFFADSFGIVNSNTSKDIKLRIYGANSFFIKSYPLHHSQKIVAKYKNSITFSLRLSITNDFVMELMKYGSDISVITPLSLKERLLLEYKKAIKVLETNN